jgi:hypothetical protein
MRKVSLPRLALGLVALAWGFSGSPTEPLTGTNSVVRLSIIRRVGIGCRSLLHDDDVHHVRASRNTAQASSLD